MNIPPDNQPNDLNRDPSGTGSNAFFSSLRAFATQVYEANREWTDAKDFAVRLAVPLFGMAATAMFRQYLEKRDRLLSEEESKLKQAQALLQAEKKAFELEKGVSLDRPIAKVVDDLMARGNQRSYKALEEIEALQPLIEDVLKIKCSPTTSKEKREPLEKEIRTRLLRRPSPFDNYGTLKAQVLEDTIDIFKKDIAHCDLPWPFGHNNNGELYKIYKENWRLRVELEKHKQIIQQLKHPSSGK